MRRSPIPKLLYQKIFVAIVRDIVINILVGDLKKYYLYSLQSA